MVQHHHAILHRATEEDLQGNSTIHELVDSHPVQLSLAHVKSMVASLDSPPEQ